MAAARALTAGKPLRLHDLQTDIDLIADIAMVPRMLEILSGTTGMRFAAVARVTENRWVACSVLDNAGLGLKPADELKVETTLCEQVHSTRATVHFNDALTHPTYCAHITPSLYGFRSYVSVPIVLPDGTFFGTLCGLDPEPREVSTPAVLGMFQLFADIIAQQIAMRRQLDDSQSALRDARAVAELREQFVAVLGHDLRSPLASIQSCIQLLEDETDRPEEAFEFTRIARQNVQRMTRLTEDVLDLARSRLGGGISLHRAESTQLAVRLHQVVEEVAVSHPDRLIDARIAIDAPAPCDVDRVCQLFANLLGNAVAHGLPDRPIHVEAAIENAALSLSVVNAGASIDPAMRPRLFEPFVRSDGAQGREGLGLGLFIANEIARAHGGTLSFTSDDAETRFTFHMPLPERAG